MAGLLLKNICKSFGATEVLKGVDLTISNGEFVVLVGPSGCGKSTLLRCIAGLEFITSGDLFIGDDLVNDLPPKSRNIAMVFQSYALYPHMTVRRNMAFGLEIRREPKQEISRRVDMAAGLLGLEDLLHRYPRQLSGGQRQRVAMGRAMVRQPSVFLFDEPLSNLDAALRVQMRAELARLHQRMGTTMIYVTHDQVEAMTLADRIVVLHEGEVQQVGAPLELYHRPANRFVAGFIGSPSMNFLRGRMAVLREGEVGVELAGKRVALPPGRARAGDGEEVEVGVRPEHLEITSAEEGDIHTRVELVEPMGWDAHVHLAFEPSGADGEPEHPVVIVRAEAARVVGLEPKQVVGVRLPAESIHLFDARDGTALGAPSEQDDEAHAGQVSTPTAVAREDGAA